MKIHVNSKNVQNQGFLEKFSTQKFID